MVCVMLMIGVSILEAEKYIFVDLDNQMAYGYEDGEVVISGRVSTGIKDHRTPEGRYNILEKKRYHVSNLWPKPNGGAKMNYLLRLTNDGIAMHLGHVSKWPASHGCIRMKNGFAQDLWSWAEIGTEVEVVGLPPERFSSDESSENFYGYDYVVYD